MKRITAAFLLMIFAVSSNTFVFAQVRRASTATKSLTKPAETEAPEDPAIDDPLNNFVRDGLPEKAILAGSDIDQAAVSAAKEILKLEDDSLPMLIAAVELAGFSIIDENRKIMSRPEKGRSQGMAFYNWELPGMLKLADRGIVTSLDQWMGLATRDNERFTKEIVAETILRDLRKQAGNTENELLRFWARLIIELGRQSEQPVDLMNVGVPEARLNMVQASLWERRLTGDMILVKEEMESQARREFNLKPGNYLALASYAAGESSFEAPCALNDNQGLVVDAAANGLGVAHGELIGAIGKMLGEGSKGAAAIQKLSTGLSWANIALSWGKLVAAHMVLKADLKVEDPLPLVRTPNSVPGQRRLMTAKIWADVGKLQYLNCVRTALNASTGMDFSLPSDGPLSERDVSWELVGDASFAGQKSSKTGVFKPYVNLEAPEGAKRNFHEQISDENGETKMNIVGAPKIPSVVFIKAMKVNKKANVRVSIALKSARDTGQNLIDIGGAALGIIMGGPLGIVSALPELGFRNKRPIIAKNVPVEDRDPCEENWSGTITFTRSGTHEQRTPKSTRTFQDFEEVSYMIKGREPERPPEKPAGFALDDQTYAAEWAKILENPGLATADASVTILNKETFNGMIDADLCCPEGQNKPGTRVEKKLMSGEAMKNVIVRFVYDDYSLRFSLESAGDGLSIDGLLREVRSTTGTMCMLDKAGDGDRSESMTLMPIFGYQYEMKIRPESANGVETISGQDTQPFGNGKITVKWDLAKCK